MNDRRVLVLDPDEDERGLVESTARLLGAECDWCATGEEALRRISERPYEAILLDILVDDSTGYELCRAVKADPETADVPILFATQRNRADDILDGFQALAFDFLVKPYRPRELRVRLQNALRMKALLDETKARARFYERVFELGRRLSAAASPEEAARTIERELEDLSLALGAAGISLEVGGRTLFSAGDAGAPVAAEIPFETAGLESAMRIRRSSPADSEERARLADLCATLARWIVRLGLHAPAGVAG